MSKNILNLYITNNTDVRKYYIEELKAILNILKTGRRQW